MSWIFGQKKDEERYFYAEESAHYPLYDFLLNELADNKRLTAKQISFFRCLKDGLKKAGVKMELGREEERKLNRLLIELLSVEDKSVDSLIMDIELIDEWVQKLQSVVGSWGWNPDVDEK